MASPSKRIAIIQGHPDPRGGHLGHALAEAYAAGAREAGHQIETIAVAALEFPLLRTRAELEGPETPDDIRRAQRALAGADHIVLIHPVWNGSAPAIVRGFFEQTFRPAFIFPDARPGAVRGFSAALKQRRGLKGKTGRVIATMQMPGFVYRWFFRPHPERNTLRLSGVGPVRETYIGQIEGARAADRRARWLHEVGRLGRAAQ